MPRSIPPRGRRGSASPADNIQHSENSPVEMVGITPRLNPKSPSGGFSRRSKDSTTESMHSPGSIPAGSIVHLITPKVHNKSTSGEFSGRSRKILPENSTSSMRSSAAAEPLQREAFSLPIPLSPARSAQVASSTKSLNALWKQLHDGKLRTRKEEDALRRKFVNQTCDIVPIVLKTNPLEALKMMDTAIIIAGIARVVQVTPTNPLGDRLLKQVQTSVRGLYATGWVSFSNLSYWDHPDIVSADSAYKIAVDDARTNCPSRCQRPGEIIEMEYRQHIYDALDRPRPLECTPFVVVDGYAHHDTLPEPDSAFKCWHSPMFWVNPPLGERSVPVEIGHRDDPHYEVKIMTIRHYVENFVFGAQKCLAYLAQYNMLDHLPELAEMIEEPECVSMATRGMVQKNIYFACDEQFTQLHHDPQDNFLVCVSGLKYVRLFSPAQNHHLVNPRAGLGDAHMSHVSFDILNYERRRAQGCQGKPDPEMKGFYMINDLEKKYIDFLLCPGDTLFIPQGWWHFCKSLATPTITITHSFHQSWDSNNQLNFEM
jgi:hypothetical protein